MAGASSRAYKRRLSGPFNFFGLNKVKQEDLEQQQPEVAGPQDAKVIPSKLEPPVIPPPDFDTKEGVWKEPKHEDTSENIYMRVKEDADADNKT